MITLITPAMYALISALVARQLGDVIAAGRILEEDIDA